MPDTQLDVVHTAESSDAVPPTNGSGTAFTWCICPTASHADQVKGHALARRESN